MYGFRLHDTFFDRGDVENATSTYISVQPCAGCCLAQIAKVLLFSISRLFDALKYDQLVTNVIIRSSPLLLFYVPVNSCARLAMF